MEKITTTSRSTLRRAERVSYDFAALNQIAIEDVISRFNLTIFNRGGRRLLCCPFHDDRHPSMSIYRNRVRCFVCQESLGVIDFVMRKEDKGLMEACEWLADTFGVGREVTEVSSGAESRSSSFIKRGKASKVVRSTILALQETVNRARLSRSYVPEQPQPDAPYVFTLDYVADHLSHDSSFCKCLRVLFDAETIDYVVESYGLGCYAGESTMFPVIDGKLRVHNIKIQHYDTDPLSPTFFHKNRGKAWWYASRYLATHPDASGIHDIACLFGEHLISRFPSSIIVLVESPKNAILGTCVWPQYVWVATGSKGMLTRERLECLRGRRVIVMPDADAADEWQERLDGMRDIATFVMSHMVDEFRRIGEKADVGDWVVESS